MTSGLTKSYGATSVLKGVDFSVARGEIHALLGGNGAGKSTMIRIITGSAAKDGGEIEFRDGAGNLRPEAEGRRNVTVVHQELALLPQLTVAENIVLSLSTGKFDANMQRRTPKTAMASST